jgi:hypothetical protein
MTVPDSVKIFESLDTKLIEAGKWAIRFFQILGYFPISIWKNEFLEFRLISISVFSNLTFVALLPAMAVILRSYEGDDFKVFRGFYSDTEIFVYTFINVIRFYFVLGLKLLGVFQYRRIKALWHQASALLTKFSISGFNFYGEEGNVLNGVRKYCMRSAIFIYAGALLQFISVALVGLSHFIPNAQDLPKTFSSVIGFWDGYMLLHAGHMVWIQFFVKFYSGLLHLISREFHRANDAFKSEPANTELKIQACIALFYEVETGIELFNTLFSSRIIYELLISMINILTFSFFSIRLVAIFGGLTIGEITYLVPCLVYLKNLNDLGSSASEINSESKKIVKALEKFSNLNLRPRTLLQVRTFMVHLIGTLLIF